MHVADHEHVDGRALLPHAGRPELAPLHGVPEHERRERGGDQHPRQDTGAQAASAPAEQSGGMRARLFLVLGIAVVVTAVWFTNHAQHEAATRAFEESQSGQGMLTAMLDQQTGLRGFALTRREEYLDPYRTGQTDFKLAAAEARSLAGPEVRG